MAGVGLLMETTRRGFFGFVAGALAGVPLCRLVPPADVYQPVEAGYSLLVQKLKYGAIPIAVNPWLVDESSWFIDSGTLHVSEPLFDRLKGAAPDGQV